MNQDKLDAVLLFSAMNSETMDKRALFCFDLGKYKVEKLKNLQLQK